MSEPKFYLPDLERVYLHLKTREGIEFLPDLETLRFTLNGHECEVSFLAASGYATMMLKIDETLVGSFWALQNLDEMLNKILQ